MFSVEFCGAIQTFIVVQIWSTPGTWVILGHLTAACILARNSQSPIVLSLFPSYSHPIPIAIFVSEGRIHRECGPEDLSQAFQHFSQNKMHLGPAPCFEHRCLSRTDVHLPSGGPSKASNWHVASFAFAPRMESMDIVDGNPGNTSSLPAWEFTIYRPSIRIYNLHCPTILIPCHLTICRILMRKVTAVSWSSEKARISECHHL